MTPAERAAYDQIPRDHGKFVSESGSTNKSASLKSSGKKRKTYRRKSRAAPEYCLGTVVVHPKNAEEYGRQVAVRCDRKGRYKKGGLVRHIAEIERPGTTWADLEAENASDLSSDSEDDYTSSSSENDEPLAYRIAKPARRPSIEY